MEIAHNIDAILAVAVENGTTDYPEISESIARLIGFITLQTSLEILQETDRLLILLLSAKTLDITWKLLIYKALKKARALAVALAVLRYAPSNLSLTQLYRMSRGPLEDLLRTKNENLFKSRVTEIMLFEADGIGITCANPTSYREYRLKQCRPCGWHQVNNDCWLAGFMYAAFASSALAPVFSAGLDRMWTSGNRELRALAVQLSRFLAAIDDPKYPGECIAGIKREIFGAMDSYQKKTNFMDAWSTAMEDEVSVAGDGTVGRGSVQPLLKLFAHIGGDNIALEMKFNSGCDIISAVLDIVGSSVTSGVLHDKAVFIINFDGMDPMKCDKNSTPTTRAALEAATTATGWTLESVIYGNAAHYWVDTRCGGTWSSYNGITVGPNRAWGSLGLTGITLFFTSNSVSTVPGVDSSGLA